MGDAQAYSPFEKINTATSVKLYVWAIAKLLCNYLIKFSVINTIALLNHVQPSTSRVSIVKYNKFCTNFKTLLKFNPNTLEECM